ncbi:MAG: aminotransferase class I/II-fold pyridoxal phosphate-dependent enzyme [Chloroflexota bacterium]
MFTEMLHVGRPNIGARESLSKRLDEILDRRWLTNTGPCVQELEETLAARIGAKHCIAMCNGTVALEIAIRAAGLTGEVIVPSMTFVATAHALQWQEITPIFCDIDPETHNIDPEQIERLITPRTTGIIGVHLWGRPCNVEALAAIAEKHNLKLLFDAAHAFDCSYKGRLIGNFGDAEVFSFHATKFFNTLEGGAVVTNDDELAKKIRLMKNFGFEKMDKVVYIGTNGKMNEFSAAVGLTLLEDLESVVAVNKRNYEHYYQELAHVPGVKLIQYDESSRCNYQYMILEIDESLAGISRGELVAILRSENVMARRYFYPGCHRMEPYLSYYPNAGLLLPETERLVERVIALPTGTAMDATKVKQVCQLIRLAIERRSEVQERLQQIFNGTFNEPQLVRLFGEYENPYYVAPSEER